MKSDAVRLNILPVQNTQKEDTDSIHENELFTKKSVLEKKLYDEINDKLKDLKEITYMSLVDQHVPGVKDTEFKIYQKLVSSLTDFERELRKLKINISSS